MRFRDMVDTFAPNINIRIMNGEDILTEVGGAYAASLDKEIFDAEVYRIDTYHERTEWEYGVIEADGIEITIYL